MEEQREILANINRPFHAGKTFIQLLADYITIATEARCETVKGNGIKTLTPKRILRKLSIALIQVKTGNTSEQLLIKSCKFFIHFIEQRK